jgi:predicted amidohydrolase
VILVFDAVLLRTILNHQMQDIKAAICQNKPGYDKRENINHACAMIDDAARNGAKLITLSEIFYHPYDLNAIKRIADTDSVTLDILREQASKNSVYLCTGSMAVKKDSGVGNTAYLISPSGEILLEYSKSHLFDVELNGRQFRESSFISAGNSLKVAETPIGNIGILICYDIRFPETARSLALKGVEIIIVPAAFNTVTGPAHWNILFRARAIENQVYILAGSQARIEGSVYEAYGHSMTVDPWGEILCEAGEDESVIYSNLSASRISRVRNDLPLLSQRRPELYDIIAKKEERALC